MWWLWPVALAVVLGAAGAFWFLSKPRSHTSSSAGSTSAAPPGKQRPVTIFYATQSGTALTFAEELAREAKSYGLTPKIQDLEDYETENLQNEEYAIFLLATYGEGEPTDSALVFTEWLMDKERTSSEFETLKYTVFGLGNKKYEFFNEQARQVDKRLKELGAQQFFPRGEGDDDGKLEQDWNDWKERFWPVCLKFFGLTTDDFVAVKFEPSFRIVYPAPAAPADLATANIYPKGFRKNKNGVESGVRYAKVVANYELRSKDRLSPTDEPLAALESTRHIELDISGTGLSYRTADNLGVCPRNSRKDVSFLIKKLGYEADRVFTLKALNFNLTKKPPVSAAMTVNEALLWHVDITSPPKRRFVAALAEFATDAKDKAKLNSWGKKAKASEEKSDPVVDEFEQIFEIERHSLVEIFRRIDSIKIPLEFLLELLPKMQPRFYTISSSNVVHKDRIHITVSALRKPISGSASARIFCGLCSNFLAHRSADGSDLIPVFVRESSFRLPKKDPFTTPVVMIGPGTGIAPFRAFIQEATAYQALNGADSVRNWRLYFGCRKKDDDFIYKDELKKAEDSKILEKLSLAFSREQKEKIYVQHRLKDDFEELYKLYSSSNMHFFICGATEMGRDVRESVIEMFQKLGGLSAEEASSELRKLQNEGRFVQELWG